MRALGRHWLGWLLAACLALGAGAAGFGHVRSLGPAVDAAHAGAIAHHHPAPEVSAGGGASECLVCILAASLVPAPARLGVRATHPLKAVLPFSITAAPASQRGWRPDFYRGPPDQVSLA